MPSKLSIFDLKSDWLKDDIYVHGLKDEIKEITRLLGGPGKLSKRLEVNYNSCFREWTNGRTPVPLAKLERMISFCNANTATIIKSRISDRQCIISCRYSPHKMLFPSSISEDLSYLAGLILGDGSLAGDSSNARGNWNITALFDDINHQKMCDELIKKEFQISPKNHKDESECWLSVFSSKTTQWFWRSFFEMHNGYKASKISFPKIILDSPNNNFRIALLQGLFDSDGSITKRKSVQYASTSKIIVDQVSAQLSALGIVHSKAVWIKDKKYLPLYSIAIRRKSSVLSFAHQIGFRHPRKASILNRIALSSSGQG
ncbi:MAG: hypothetical protein IPJ89_03005 [Candidatus Iainarchaeum archaeon]|uniref:DOD-type homing endonuclease domain-containing protein n=1 Tax=Candidatus Iainarchaeum sp. TaxID=3101447 RepID=A0A7T9DIZ0_9ARCH|nr:MAG: hypothetical protein IPJ89_03005 [Candidatus Diapherotrites archaeon]